MRAAPNSYTRTSLLPALWPLLLPAPTHHHHRHKLQSNSIQSALASDPRGEARRAEGQVGYLMGANMSGDEDRRTYPGLADVPENCVAGIFKHLSPVDICKLAGLNWAFKSAASCDYVWEQKLPSCYHFILTLLPHPHPHPHPHPLSKKQIYALLCRPLPFDGASKEVYLDRATGGVCISISARAMAITGIDDHRYWNWIHCEESRFHEVAYLQQIWWFEVDGVLKFQLPAGEYCLSFRLRLGKPSKRLGRRINNFEQTHGWELKPVRFSLSTSEGEHKERDCYLEEATDLKDASLVSNARGSWNDYYVGKFNVYNENKLTEIRFSMTQIDCTHSKGGLCLDTVSIFPTKLWKEKKEAGKG